MFVLQAEYAFSRMLIGIAATLLTHAADAAVTFSGVGSGGSASAKAAFTASIGGANNGVGGSYSSGYRSINWDSVPDALAAPHLLPASFYNFASPRGLMLITPGSGVEVSASTASGLALYFGNINSTYTSNFAAVSAQRVFAPIDSNIVQVYFFQPGTNTPAIVRGFGAIFKDVELANMTSIRYFAFDGSDLGEYFVPVGNSGDTEFFGALFAPTEPVGHVVITLGTQALGASTTESASVDLVVMDDIVYSEPVTDDIFGDGFD